VIRRLLTGLVLLTTAAAASSPTPHQAWTRAALGRLPVAVTDRAPELAEAKRAQLDAMALAMAHESLTAPVSPRQWVAVLGAIGFRESSFSLDVQAGKCANHQCDPRKLRGGSIEFRARSNFQLHQNDHTSPVWEQLIGVENTAVQVAAASKMAKVGHHRCARLGVSFPESVWRGFAGGSCSFEHPGEKARTATYLLLLQTATPKKEAS
jgi:hypothetical protein